MPKFQSHRLQRRLKPSRSLSGRLANYGVLASPSGYSSLQHSSQIRGHSDAQQARAQVPAHKRRFTPYVKEGEAKVDLTAAQDALARGDALLKAGKPVADVNHEAYMAERFALAAQKGAELNTSTKAIADANNRRNAVLLVAREGDAARANQLAQAKSRELDVALADLKASKTDRGVVITLGDVLFATGSANLKSGSRQTLDKLTAFLQAYPKRAVQIDGYTDNVGSDDYNQQLSERRADSVRDALTGMGIRRVGS